MDTFEFHLKKINYLRHKYLKTMKQLKNDQRRQYIMYNKHEDLQDILNSIDFLLIKLECLRKNTIQEPSLMEDIENDMIGNKIIKKFLPYMLVYSMKLNIEAENEINQEILNQDDQEIINNFQ